MKWAVIYHWDGSDECHVVFADGGIVYDALDAAVRGLLLLGGGKRFEVVGVLPREFVR